MRLRLLGWPVNGDIPAQTQEQLEQALRDLRDILLKECDWTQTLDCALSVEIKNDWQIWRQYMRDLPNNADRPLQYTIEILDPPATGRPRTWVNVDDSNLPPLQEWIDKLEAQNGSV